MPCSRLENGDIVDTESRVGAERGAVAIERDVLSERLFEDVVVFFRENNVGIPIDLRSGFTKR
jgi:hypothetical protein